MGDDAGEQRTPRGEEIVRCPSKLEEVKQIGMLMTTLLNAGKDSAADGPGPREVGCKLQL